MKKKAIQDRETRKINQLKTRPDLACEVRPSVYQIRLKKLKNKYARNLAKASFWKIGENW